MSRTERAPRQSQRVAEELLALRLLATLRERGRQVGRRDQRVRVLCAGQAGRGDEDLALDLHGLGVLALLRERERQVAGHDERLAGVETVSASPHLGRTSTECLHFGVLSQTEQAAR